MTQKKQWPLLLLIAFLLTNMTLGKGGPKPLLKDFIGINGHFHFKPELYSQVCRLVRNYHNINWDVNQPGDPITFPICANRVDWNRDVYGKWADYRFEVDLCAQFGSFGESNEAYVTLWQGKEPWFNEYGYEMARYFGPSGSHRLVTSIEIGNEPGSDFDDGLYRKLFVQMARGIRKADPRIQIVTATAHAGEADEYTKSLEETFSSEPIKSLFDVINLHVYAIKPRKEGQSPWDRSFPEDASLDHLKTVDAAIAWRNSHAPDKQVWITEFGYDACTPEAMSRREGWAEKLNWTGVTDEQQAQYLVRSVFCFSERDIQRAYLYFFNDSDQASVHAASGLTRHFIPKPSFWAMKHLYETLGEYRFERVILQQAETVHAYAFRHGSQDQQAIWVVWSPTGHGRTGKVTLRGLPGTLQHAERMPLAAGPADRVRWRQLGEDTIEITVTESPVYLTFENNRLQPRRSAP